jgi:Icc protein
MAGQRGLDYRLTVEPARRSQLVRGTFQVRARVWGPEIESATLHPGGRVQQMSGAERAIWSGELHSAGFADGVCQPTVRALTRSGSRAEDSIPALVSRDGKYDGVPRKPVDYENALGAWPEKHILGTQLGPNENGRAWPSREALKNASRSNG